MRINVEYTSIKTNSTREREDYNRMIKECANYLSKLFVKVVAKHPSAFNKHVKRIGLQYERLGDTSFKLFDQFPNAEPGVGLTLKFVGVPKSAMKVLP